MFSVTVIFIEAADGSIGESGIAITRQRGYAKILTEARAATTDVSLQMGNGRKLRHKLFRLTQYIYANISIPSAAAPKEYGN